MHEGHDHVQYVSASPTPARQVGWGFTDHTPFAQQPELNISPQQKREHLYSFWQQHIQRPMALVGGSLGGAIALDFALAYPEAVEKLVLIDAQVKQNPVCLCVQHLMLMLLSKQLCMF